MGIGTKLEAEVFSLVRYFDGLPEVLLCGQGLPYSRRVPSMPEGDDYCLGDVQGKA